MATAIELLAPLAQWEAQFLWCPSSISPFLAFLLTFNPLLESKILYGHCQDTLKPIKKAECWCLMRCSNQPSVIRPFCPHKQETFHDSSLFIA